MTIVDELGRHVQGLQRLPVTPAPPPPEPWLVNRLVHTAGMDRARVLSMPNEQAVDAWNARQTRQTCRVARRSWSRPAQAATPRRKAVPSFFFGSSCGRHKPLLTLRDRYCLRHPGWQPA